MTEAEWLKCADPVEMLRFLEIREISRTEPEWLACTEPDKILSFDPTKAISRKARLFAVACCRRIWNLLPEFANRWEVDVAEAFADGRASEVELQICQSETSWDELDDNVTGARWASFACHHVTDIDAVACAIETGRFAATAFDAQWDPDMDPDVSDLPPRSSPIWEARVEQSDYLRDIFGPLPFRPVTIDPRWLTSSVVDLAAAIYEERACDRLPILADALMDAGCDNDEIIQHCRGGWVHVRGCWVIDLLLDRS
jgi:hypothetical protein